MGWPSALTVEEEGQLCERTEEEPGTSARCLTQQIGHAGKTVCRALRVEGRHSYYVLTLHELQFSDFKKSCNFCTRFKDQFGDDIEV